MILKQTEENSGLSVSVPKTLQKVKTGTLFALSVIVACDLRSPGCVLCSWDLLEKYTLCIQRCYWDILKTVKQFC